MQPSFPITKLNRANLPLKIYMRGLSGSGKTFGALTLARGICPKGKIGVIDTLGGQAHQYGGYSQFGDVECIELDAPYSADRCIGAIESAIAAGWEVIIFDTLSVHHDGEGGQLERADEEESKGAKGMGKWNKPKMETRRLMNFIRDSRVHFIGTYIMAETTDMDTKTSKISPIQTKGSEAYYTFHVEVSNVIDNQGEFHPAKWLRVPQNFQSCIQQQQEITPEIGRLLVNASATGSTAPAPAQNDGREDAIRDIKTTLASEQIEPVHFNAVIAAKYVGNGDFKTIDALPTKHLIALAKPAKLNPLIAEAIEIQRQS